DGEFETGRFFLAQIGINRRCETARRNENAARKIPFAFAAGEKSEKFFNLPEMNFSALVADLNGRPLARFDRFDMKVFLFARGDLRRPALASEKKKREPLGFRRAFDDRRPPLPFAVGENV